MGTRYEAMAAQYLEKQGYEILEKNFRCRLGEIDIVAREGAYLCFVEVKYRRSGVMGWPEEAVDANKQRRISRAADYYLLSHAAGFDVGVRFDVVAILGETLQLYRNAFSYQTR